MRLLFALLLPSLLPYPATAQCCCAHHRVDIRTPRPAHTGGKWHYTASLHGESVHRYGRVDSVPGDPYRLVLDQGTGCGVGHAAWVVRETDARSEMRVNLYDMPGDLWLPMIALPYAPGTTTYFNLEDILRCVTGHGGRSISQSGDTVRCGNGGRAFHSHGEHHKERFEPLDIGPWMVPPGKTPPDGVPMSDASLSISPDRPNAGQTIHAHLQWIDGSCGRYRHTVEVMPKTAGSEVSEILLGFGQEGPNCEDIAQIHRTIDLPPLEPGRYRIRIGPPPAGTTTVLPIGGWREFVVLP